MSSEDYRVDGVAEAEPDGAWAMAPGAGEEEEADEAHSTSSGCDSLLNLGKRKGKKKPVIMLDPGEADAAAHLLETAAAQQMANPDQFVPIGMFAGPDRADAAGVAAAFARPDGGGETAVPEHRDGLRPAASLDACAWGGNPLHSAAPVAIAEEVATGQEDEATAPLAAAEQSEREDFAASGQAEHMDMGEVEGEPADAEPLPGAPEEITARPEIDIPAAAEAMAERVEADTAKEIVAQPETDIPAAAGVITDLDEADVIMPFAMLSEAEEAEPELPFPQPAPAPRRRSQLLRAAPARRPRAWLADGVAGALRRLYRWVKRSWI